LDLAVAHVKVGLVLRSEGRFAEALQEFEEGLKPAEAAAAADPGRALFQRQLANNNYLIGKVLWASGRPQEALPYLDESIRILTTHTVGANPQSDALIYQHRALVRFNLGQLDGAAADLARAVALDPKQSAHVLWLHRVRARAHQDDAAELA